MIEDFGMINWLVLSMYIFGMLALGAVFSRRNISTGEFFFAGGRLPWWAVGISMIATSISATTFLGNPAETYAGDMTYMMLNLGVPVSIAITALVFIPYFRRNKVQSAYEILEKRFDRKTRLLASGIYSCHVLLRTGILIYGPAIVFATITGWSTTSAIMAVGVLSIAYTWMGGIRAVVWTDVIQFVILLGGGLLTLMFIAYGVEGGLTAITATAGNASKFTWFKASLDTGDAHSFLSAGVAYIVLDLAIRSCDQQFIQRYLSTQNVRKAQWATVLSAVLGAIAAWLFFLVGAFLYSYYTEHSGALPAATKSNGVFPHFILSVLPQGLSGLMVAAIFAAAMSSLDSGISALANTTVVDFMGNRQAVLSQAKRLRMARLAVLIWGCLGIIAALFASSFDASLLHTALYFTSLFTGSLLGIFIIAVAMPFARGGTAFAGALTGMLVLAICTRGLYIDLPSVSDIPIIGWIAGGLKLNLSWPWFPVISASATVSAGAGFSLVQKMYCTKEQLN